MIRRILKMSGWTVATIACLAVTLYLITLAINWRDREPSAAAVRFEKLFRDRPIVTESDNAYGYLATPGIFNHDIEKRSPDARQFFNRCWTSSSGCRADNDDTNIDLEAIVGDEVALLDSYQAVIAHTGWREAIPSNTSAVVAYRPLTDGQMILIAKAITLAKRNDAAAVRALLTKDIRFWRNVLASADVLITKMTATAAINRHFEMGSLVLRKFDPSAISKAVPPEWAVPISGIERSMLRCFVGEWVYSSNMLRELSSRKSSAPLFQTQDSINQSAANFEWLVNSLNVPLNEFPTALHKASGIANKRAQASFPPSSLYNLVGNELQSIAAPAYLPYASRVADLEGTRRAALAAVLLRESGVKPDGVRAALAASSLHNPYDNEPLGWDEQTGDIIFTGLEASARGVHRIHY